MLDGTVDVFVPFVVGVIVPGLWYERVNKDAFEVWSPTLTYNDIFVPTCGKIVQWS